MTQGVANVVCNRYSVPMPNADGSPQFVSTAEAARILGGLHYSTISRMVKEGRLPLAGRLGESERSPMYFDRSDVERVAAELAAGTDAA